MQCSRGHFRHSLGFMKFNFRLLSGLNFFHNLLSKVSSATKLMCSNYIIKEYRYNRLFPGLFLWEATTCFCICLLLSFFFLNTDILKPRYYLLLPYPVILISNIKCLTLCLKCTLSLHYLQIPYSWVCLWTKSFFVIPQSNPCVVFPSKDHVAKNVSHLSCVFPAEVTLGLFVWALIL